MILLLFVVLALTSLKFSDALLGIGSFQTINVHGSLTCDGKPAKDVLVKLYDVNSKLIVRFLYISRFSAITINLNLGIIPDNLLGEMKSNSSGKFAIKGEINDITKMDPKVNIYTDCHVGVLVRFRLLLKNVY